MSKATAWSEVPELAEKHGFTRTFLDGERTGFIHVDRAEAFILTAEDGAFDFASWHGRLKYVTVVEKRAPGERGQDGNHLTANAKRRPVGVGDVRPKMARSPMGMEVGYLELKRRIKDPDWLEKVK